MEVAPGLSLAELGAEGAAMPAPSATPGARGSPAGARARARGSPPSWVSPGTSTPSTASPAGRPIFGGGADPKTPATATAGEVTRGNFAGRTREQLVAHLRKVDAMLEQNERFREELERSAGAVVGRNSIKLSPPLNASVLDSPALTASAGKHASAHASRAKMVPLRAYTPQRASRLKDEARRRRAATPGPASTARRAKEFHLNLRDYDHQSAREVAHPAREYDDPRERLQREADAVHAGRVWIPTIWTPSKASDKPYVPTADKAASAEVSGKRKDEFSVTRWYTVQMGRACGSARAQRDNGATAALERPRSCLASTRTASRAKTQTPMRSPARERPPWGSSATVGRRLAPELRDAALRSSPEAMRAVSLPTSPVRYHSKASGALERDDDTHAGPAPDAHAQAPAQANAHARASAGSDFSVSNRVGYRALAPGAETSPMHALPPSQATETPSLPATKPQTNDAEALDWTDEDLLSTLARGVLVTKLTKKGLGRGHARVMHLYACEDGRGISLAWMGGARLDKERVAAVKSFDLVSRADERATVVSTETGPIVVVSHSDQEHGLFVQGVQALVRRTRSAATHSWDAASLGEPLAPAVPSYGVGTI